MVHTQIIPRSSQCQVFIYCSAGESFEVIYDSRDISDTRNLSIFLLVWLVLRKLLSNKKVVTYYSSYGPFSRSRNKDTINLDYF